jgi:methionyl-tRNA synthetase
MLMKSYITTPIYYVNGSPHIGHAFTSIMADILKRNREALGYEMMLSTGVDEHGQKNQEAAEALGMPVTDYLDMRCKEFRDVFEKLGVEFDYFVRTSREGHKKAVAEMEQRIFDKGLIVKKQYTGTYCKGCEEFKKERSHRRRPVPAAPDHEGRADGRDQLLPEDGTVPREAPEAHRRQSGFRPAGAVQERAEEDAGRAAGGSVHLPAENPCHPRRRSAVRHRIS